MTVSGVCVCACMCGVVWYVCVCVHKVHRAPYITLHFVDKLWFTFSYAISLRRNDSALHAITQHTES